MSLISETNTNIITREFILIQKHFSFILQDKHKTDHYKETSPLLTEGTTLHSHSAAELP